MGHVYTNIGLQNPRREEMREMEVRALVDTGANHLCLPAEILAELGLEVNSIRTVRTANGIMRRCRYVGPVKVRFEDRECFVGALELGDSVLLGAIPMEDMDLVIHPSRLLITQNPDHPEGPQSFAMGLRS